MNKPFNPEHVTTSQAAKICRCSSRSICKWFDAGLVRGYRLPGTGKDRRIETASLREFMQTQGMPLKWLDDFLTESETAKGS